MRSHPQRRPAGWGRPSLRYVALGDSYTIGTSVEPAERFPECLGVGRVTPADALAFVCPI